MLPVLSVAGDVDAVETVDAVDAVDAVDDVDTADYAGTATLMPAADITESNPLRSAASSTAVSAR